jgi:DNA modification methylase
MESLELNTIIEPSIDNSHLDFSTCTKSIYLNLKSTYEGNKLPIEVDFRKLVDWVPYADSETHYIHSYPAKLLKHIPIFFLNSAIAPSKGIIFDPFSGTGTVLLEAIKLGYDGYGCDANPVARLITKVKTTPISPKLLTTELSSILQKSLIQKPIELPNVTNIDHWFLTHIKEQLGKLAYVINSISQPDLRDFFNVCFSNILKKVSLADPNLSVPVRLKPEKYKNVEHREKATKRLAKISTIDTFEVFKKQALENIKRMSRLYKLDNIGSASIVSKDARDLILDNPSLKDEKLASNSVDMIITSPPYAGAQKYVRSSSFSLGWLGYCENNTLRDHEVKNIGREHYHKSEYQELQLFNVEEIDNRLDEIFSVNPLRAHINGNYLAEMKAAIFEMYRVLKPSKYCVIVMGNNEVCGKPFNTQHYINLIAEQAGFKTELKLVDVIHSRGLMTKRNKTASIINSEWIIILKK